MVITRCSGAMTAKHTGRDEARYRIAGRDVVFCDACADAAGRLGMIDRRVERR